MLTAQAHVDALQMILPLGQEERQFLRQRRFTDKCIRPARPYRRLVIRAGVFEQQDNFALRREHAQHLAEIESFHLPDHGI